MAARSNQSGNSYSCAVVLAARPITIACWARLRSTPSSWAAIIEHGGGNYNNMLGMITTGGNRTVAFWTASSSFTVVTMNLDQWYFLGCRVASNGQADVFYAEELGALTFNASGLTTPDYSSSTMYLLTDSDGEWADVALQNVVVWPAALTNAELAAARLVQAPKLPCSIRWGLVNHDQTQDLSGNGRHLTKTGTLHSTEVGPPVPWMPDTGL